MEQRLIRDLIKASEYRDFLAEYENLGHMTNSSDRNYQARATLLV